MRLRCGWRVAALLAAASVAVPAQAVVTYSLNLLGQRSITLQVGSNDANINLVTFDVTGANIAPTPTPVQGTPGAGAPLTTPAGGILVRLATNRRGGFGQDVFVTADSSAGMACQTPATCGTTVIPFSTVSWTSNNLQTGQYAGQDFQSGAFTDSGSQQLLVATAPGFFDSLTVTNVLIFRYANTTLYPSGVYRGRVTFTASSP